MPVSEKTYQQVALEDPEGQWELHCGRLRRKPGMTFDHNDVMNELGYLLRSQLDRRKYRVRVNSGHARRSEANYYIPDVSVIPLHLAESLRGRRNRLEVYRDPLPLVVEVWSPSTGEYDVDEKLPEYQRRGDLEIWRIHPPSGGESKGSPPYKDRVLTAWQRQPDGSYTETVYRSGTVRLVALPHVTIDLDTLFE